MAVIKANRWTRWWFEFNPTQRTLRAEYDQPVFRGCVEPAARLTVRFGEHRFRQDALHNGEFMWLVLRRHDGRDEILGFVDVPHVNSDGQDRVFLPNRTAVLTVKDFSAITWFLEALWQDQQDWLPALPWWLRVRRAVRRWVLRWL